MLNPLTLEDIISKENNSLFYKTVIRTGLRLYNVHCIFFLCLNTELMCYHFICTYYCVLFVCTYYCLLYVCAFFVFITPV